MIGTGLSTIRALIVISFALGCGGDTSPLDNVSGGSMMAEPEARPVTTRAEIAEPPELEIQSIRFEPSLPVQGSSLRAIVNAATPDAEGLTFDFKWEVGGQSLSARGPEVTLYRAKKGDIISVSVVATRGRQRSAAFEASTRVGNRAPRISGVRLEPAGPLTTEAELTAFPEAVDPDGDPISFQYWWRVNGRGVAGEGPTLSYEPDRGDVIRGEVVASDGDDESEVYEIDEIRVANATPRITSQPQGTDADGVFRYVVTATDADDDTDLRYSLIEAPQGMKIRPREGAVEWHPTKQQFGRHSVEIAVRDGDGAQRSQRFEIVVGSNEPEEQAVPAAQAD